MSLFKFSVSLILIALSTHCTANELGGFADTCTNTSLNNNVLYSTCQGTAGTGYSTSIELDKCLVNANGNLYCAANGGYSSTCSGCSFNSGSSTLTCTCKGSDQVGKTASIDLNSCLTNNYGNLAC